MSKTSELYHARHRHWPRAELASAIQSRASDTGGRWTVSVRRRMHSLFPAGTTSNTGAGLRDRLGPPDSERPDERIVGGWATEVPEPSGEPDRSGPLRRPTHCRRVPVALEGRGTLRRPHDARIVLRRRAGVVDSG